MAKEKKTKRTPQKLAKKFENELPEVAKRLGIRVSNPYGYYPEDVDKIIVRLEQDISDLTKENKQLSQELHDTKNKATLLQSELSQIKMQVSLMEIPDVSTEESFAMLSRVGTITGENVNMPVTEVSTPAPSTIKTVTIKSDKSDEKKPAQQTTYSNLIKPKIKL